MRSHRIWYLILIAIVFLFNIFFGQHLSYCAFWLTLILPFPFFPLLRYTSRRIGVRLDTALPAAGRGEELPFSIIVYNQSRLPLSCGKITLSFDNILTREHYEQVLPFSVPARGSTRIDWSAVSHHSGCVRVSVRKLRLYDLLGLFARNLRPQTELRLLSMPYPISLLGKGTFPVQGDNDHCRYSEDKPGSDPSETFGIREYQVGDSPRSVHWKLSSKLDRLMVRQFSLPASDATLLITETGGLEDADPRLIDALLDARATLSAHFLEQNIPHASAWYDSQSAALRLREIKDSQDSARDGAELLCVPLPGGPPCALRAFFSLPARGYARIVYLTAALAAEELAILRRENASSRLTVLCCCGEEAPPSAEKARLSGIPVTLLQPGLLAQELLSLEL